MTGPSNIHLELSAKCDKQCHRCQRREAEIEAPDIVRSWDYMDMGLVDRLSHELPGGILLSLHGRGEPLQYPELGKALDLLSHNDRILHFDSNIKYLTEKADEVIDRLDILTVSLLEGNSHNSNLDQYENLRKFLKVKAQYKPRVVIRVTGNVKSLTRWDKLGLPIIYRPLHDRRGRNGYSRPPSKPEFHVCLEMLQRLFIAFNGECRPCVRYDVWGENLLGDLCHETLDEVWNGMERAMRLMDHVTGVRSGFCEKCQYWGIPRG